MRTRQILLLELQAAIFSETDARPNFLSIEIHKCESLIPALNPVGSGAQTHGVVAKEGIYKTHMSLTIRTEAHARKMKAISTDTLS